MTVTTLRSCLILGLVTLLAGLAFGFTLSDYTSSTGDPTIHLAQDETPADYTVHEWGLVRFVERPEIATSGFGTAPEAPRPEDMDEDYKPVIYFHPGPTFDPRTSISTTITIEGGVLQEVWPTPLGGAQPEHGPSFTWPSVVVRPGSACGGDLGPTNGDLACADLGICEAAELRLYMPSVPHCLVVTSSEGHLASEILTPILLYNGYLPAERMPLSVYTDVEGMSVTGISETPVGPVWIRDGSRILRVDSFESGHVVTCEGNSAFGPLLAAQLWAEIQDALVERGLTDEEAQQFLAAWQPDVLSDPYPWAVFGFFSAEQIDEYFPLTLDPQPSATARVIAFTIE